MFSEEGINNPTEFGIFFRTRVAEYKYALYIQNGVVVNESLDRVKLDRDILSFYWINQLKELKHNKYLINFAKRKSK